MDFSFYNMLIDISVLLYGVYGMIDWIRLIKAGKLVNSRLACPGGVKAEDCIDPKEYYELVKPKIFWFSLINIICGVTNLYFDIKPTAFSTYITNLVIIVFIISIIVFCMKISKIVHKYFA